MNRLTPGTKRADVLQAFIDRGRRGLNCFEAVGVCHDYVLRTTVSEFRRDFGIAFEKERETVPALGGSKTAECVRYRLTPEGEAMARDLLAGAELGAADTPQSPPNVAGRTQAAGAAP